MLNEHDKGVAQWNSFYQHSTPMNDLDELEPLQPLLDDEDDDEEEDEEEEETKDKKKNKGGAVEVMMARKFLEQRKIFLWGGVVDKTAQDVVGRLLYLDGDEPNEPIHFYVNSPGGSITAGMAIYDTIKMITAPVTVVVTGLAASMGSILLSAPKKGRRLLYPHARVMIHQPLIMGRIIAPAVDINIQAEEMEKWRDLLNKILAEASGQALEKVAKDTDRDFYLDAEATIEYGLADRIITSMDQI